MAGLGKYKKGAKFTLKSGNTPLFKHIGSSSSPSPITTSSPANLNSFGVGKGTSPYMQTVDEVGEGSGTYEEYKADMESKGIEADSKESWTKLNNQNQTSTNATDKKQKTGKIAGNVAQMFMAGINNVYGNPNEKAALSSDRLNKTKEELAKEKADKETLTIAQKIIADSKKSKV